MSTAADQWKATPQWRLAFNDLLGGLRAHRVWMLLARMDIRQRYRRRLAFWV